MDISFKSDRLKMSSGRPGESVFLASLAGAFSSGASAVAVVVAEPSSALVLLLELALLLLLARVRGVRCDISVLLYAVFKRPLIYASLWTAQNGRAAVVVN
jgi:hypothetical protein